MSNRRRYNAAFGAVTVLKIWERDRGRCVRCGESQVFGYRGRSWSVHHRRPRGMGGTSLPWVAEAANGIVLCGDGVSGCHGWVETHRGEAVEAGWLVSKLGYLTAADVPVMYPDGLWRLDDGGGKELQHDRGD